MAILDDYLSSHIIRESIYRLYDGTSDSMDNYNGGSTVDLDDVKNQSADDAYFTGTRAATKLLHPSHIH